MLFHSFAYLLFLPLVYVLHWRFLAGRVRARNAFLLAASWLFYAWWDWRFLGLLLFSSAADYLIGLRIHAQQRPGPRRAWLALSIALNLGLLGFFKYYGFFVEGFAGLLRAAGLQPHLPVLRIVLPVGISFYTFQTLSYAIDIHRRRLAPTRDPLAFFAFVAFFPQLVAGPIERARDLLPQFLAPSRFSHPGALDGLRQLLWGFFKKIVVADGCAPLADAIFHGDPATKPGATLFFGAVFFAFQIYGDFSGYSDIAIGSARLLGFRLSRNFAYPYFSRSIAEFWRRWHITLGSWFRDYVYLPLGGGLTRATRARNLMATFALSGLWHGANWTFAGWGLLHGAYHLPLVAAGAKARGDDATWRDLHRIAFTFVLVTLAWVLFRAPTLRHASDYVLSMARNALASPGAALLHLWRPELLWAAVMLAAEWRARRLQHALEALPASTPLRWGIYLALALLIIAHIDLRTPHAFLYFQF